MYEKFIMRDKRIFVVQFLMHNFHVFPSVHPWKKYEKEKMGKIFACTIFLWLWKISVEKLVQADF